MKVHVKGGPWTNTEDEMLRAGVMKYGKQNWGRVASLVTRKTAAQCKARWAEWLDPAINKGEWAHDEDERLLELFQVMPHMWRTIAGQLHGRTAGMCNERYEILLDRARRKEAGEEATDKVEFATMDHHHESKPARADAADQDQYERDMLDAARGRLANTKGKKELRRMRDRKLQEARHRADMQRQRELREAGAAAAATTVSASVAAKAVGDVDHREGGAGPYDATADDAAAERLRRARARDDEADFTPVDVAVVDGAAPKKRVREGEGAQGAQAAATARPAAPPKIASFSFTFDSKQASAARTARRAAATTAVAAPPAAAAAAIAAALPTLEINAEQRLKAKATAGQSFLALFNRTAGATGADDGSPDDSLGPALRQSLRPAPRPLLSAVASLSADAWASSAAPGTAEELVAKETVAVMKADLFAATAAGPQRRTDAAVAGAYAVSDDDPRALAQRLVQAELAATAAQETAALAAITPLTVKATTVQPPQGPMCLATAAELDGLRAEARALLRVRDDLRAIGDRSAAALLRAAPVPRSVVPAAGDEAARLGRLELARTLRRYSCASDVYRRVRDDELASIAAMRLLGDAVATTAAATACD